MFIDIMSLSNLSPREVWKLTLKEYNYYIQAGRERIKRTDLQNLDLAIHICSMVLNNKAKEYVESQTKRIMGEPKKIVPVSSDEEFKNSINLYKGVK